VVGMKIVVDSSLLAAYDAEFYRSRDDGTRRPADNVVPLLIEPFRPQSVVDVGSGTGLWLSAFYQIVRHCNPRPVRPLSLLRFG
jgi:hypothetical protein